MSNLATLDGPFLLTPSGLTTTTRPTFEEWAEVGKWLGRASEAINWAVGDWLLIGDATFGEKASQAMDATGLEYKTLSDCRWVASRFEPSRRRGELDFAHHREAASLKPDEADEVLAQAVRENLSKSAVRALVAQKRHEVGGWDQSREEDAIRRWLEQRRAAWPTDRQDVFALVVARLAKEIET